jgi:hypothetical protein
MFTVTVGLWLRNVDPTSCSKEPVRSSVCIFIGLSVCLFICCVSICVLDARVKCSAPSHFLFDMTLHSISAVHVRMRSKSYSKKYARHIVHALILLFKWSGARQLGSKKKEKFVVQFLLFSNLRGSPNKRKQALSLVTNYPNTIGHQNHSISVTFLEDPPRYELILSHLFITAQVSALSLPYCLL